MEWLIGCQNEKRSAVPKFGFGGCLRIGKPPTNSPPRFGRLQVVVEPDASSPSSTFHRSSEGYTPSSPTFHCSLYARCCVPPRRHSLLSSPAETLCLPEQHSGGVSGGGASPSPGGGTP
ncbi:hypothetical protein PIB30_060900 [Stylosanthes scabra]|uniref:Uncharacterized protein n=1 Tax=Stylosanthes scabra TaxID=79078 RepID=A0ABU6WNJ3_9FABA|nr:hypothetical protein [Stylosanthes scabra]